MQISVNRLIVQTFVFLALPFLLFFVGWLQPMYGLPILAITIAGFYLAFKELLASNEGDNFRELNKRNYYLLAAVALVFTVLSGVGELVYQHPDYFKHNLIHNDLVQNQWPVVYNEGGQTTFLCYGIAYYLPTALLGKLTGVSWVPYLSLAYTFIGVFLVFLWIFIFIRTLKPLYIALFLFVSGFDFLWYLGHLIYFLLLYFPEHGFMEIVAYTKGSLISEIIIPHIFTDFLSVSNNFGGFPQHALSGFLASFAVIYFIINKYPIKYTSYAILLVTLWSPLTVIGMLPFGLYHLIKQRNELFSKQIVLPVITCLTIGFPVFFYYLAHLPINSFDFIWELRIPLMPQGAWWVYTLAFIVLDFGLLFLLFFYADKKKNFIAEYRGLAILSFFVLLGLCFFKIGIFNDSSMRASVTAIIIMLVLCIRYVQTIDIKGLSKIKKLLFAGIILAMIAPRVFVLLNKVKKAVAANEKTFNITDIPEGKTIYYHNDWMKITPPFDQFGVMQDDGKPHMPDITPQYLGSTNSFFYQHLAKKP